jgi:DNA-binding MarR family transcriptional regulator
MTRSGEPNSIRWIQDVDAVAALIYFTYRSVQRHLTKELALHHMGWGHFAIMMALYDHEGISQEGLARSRGFDKTMLAKSIMTLEKESLVYRKNDLEDKRVKRLFLTEKGKSIRPELERIGAEMNASLLEGMDADEASAAMACVRNIAINADRLE